jgi:hypothetical protein
MFLNADNVHKTFMECLFKDGEPTDGYVQAEGVLTNVGFHPERLKKNTGKIRQMLLDLPKEFMKSSGGGYSFLNACQTKEDFQWADLHRTIDELVCLGIATQYVHFNLPREMWKILPGGMPYFFVDDEKE